MPEFFEVIKKRRSIRKYQNKEVEPEKIETILENVILSQTAGNLQSYVIFVIKNHDIKEALTQAAYGQEFIKQAPIVFVVCADQEKAGSVYGKRGYELYSINDASIVATYIELIACALGLGTCWVGAFDEQEVKQILGLPEGIKPIAIIPCGYPAEQPKMPKKKRDMIYFVE
ncbi:MAG TPA: hypothetical protein EYH56_00145 [Nanoarchaeota archaeon]|nr:hypothetical protein [Nanoarchaeota archaeon]